MTAPERDDASGEQQEAAAPPPTGKASRLWRLGTLSTKVAASYVGSSVASIFRTQDGREDAQRRLQTRTAERLVRAMSELKGAAMKVGQVLSIQDGVLPFEMRDTLSALQTQAPPMHYLYAKEVIEGELGRTVGEAFAELERRPIAAASLGQVHRGRLHDGRRVAVKVQYPGIEETIESDLAALRRAVGSMRLAGRRFDLREAFEEVACMLRRETDYVQEADAIERFRGALAGADDIVIPGVHRELSTARVLTLEYLDGEHLDAFVAAQPDQASRDAMGARLARVIWELEFHHGLLHGDPHPGNYLFMEGDRLGLLDFGCVKVFEPDFLRDYRAMIEAVLARDDDAVAEAFVRLGFMAAEERGTRTEAGYLEWVYLSCEPLLYDGVWDGDWEEFLQRMHRKMQELALSVGVYQPREAVYLNRVLLGIMCFWNRLDVRLNWNRLLREVLEAATAKPPVEG